jgi:hypothetical protein
VHGQSLQPRPDRALLESLAGEYEAGSVVITITVLEDNTLTLHFPGQQLYHLEPETNLRYRLRELPAGFAAEFVRDASGKVTSMTVHQPPPQQDFVARRKASAPAPGTAAKALLPQAAAPAPAPASGTEAGAGRPDLAGEYEAGPVVMTVTLLQDNTLTLHFPGQQLYHLDPETNLRYRIRELAAGFAAEFVRDASGKVTSLVMHQPPPQQDFLAKRKSGAPAPGRQDFAGEYEVGTVVMTVTVLQDGSMTFLMPGQPLYHLDPEGGLRYRVRELAPGYSVEFLRDVKGVTTGITVYQPPPQQNFSAARKRGA